LVVLNITVDERNPAPAALQILDAPTPKAIQNDNLTGTFGHQPAHQMASNKTGATSD
jgi:hypothetical protein